MKRFISVLLSLVMMLGLLAYLPIQVKAYEEVKSTVYTDWDLVGGKGNYQFNARKYLKDNGTINYRAWSQCHLPWGLYKLGNNTDYATFNAWGCFVVAAAKIAVQSGNYTVNNMDPGIMNELMQRNGCFASTNGNFTNLSKIANLIGMTYSASSFDKIVSTLKADSSTQFIIHVNGKYGDHYIPVNNDLTIKYGEVYIDDSWTSNGTTMSSNFTTARNGYQTRTDCSTINDYVKKLVGVRFANAKATNNYTVKRVFMFTKGVSTPSGVIIESYSNKTAGTTGDTWLYPAFKVTVPNYKNSKVSTVGYSVYTVNDTEMFRFEETYRSGVNQDGTSYKNTFFGARTDGGANMDLEKDIYNIKKEYLTDLRFLPGHNYIVRGFVVFDGKRYESDGHRMKTTGIGDQHMYDDGYVAAEPTCIYKGVMKYICRMCGCSKTESIPPKGHTPGAAATCTTPQKCTVCGTQLASPTDHKFDNGIISKEPTCLDDGVKTYACSLCGETKTEPIISGKRHTPGAAATCTTPQKCTVCGTQLAAALGHNYTGSYYYSSHPHEEYQKCTRCNAEKKTGSTKKIDGCSICYPTFTITYNANGGTGEPASQTKTNGKALTLSSTKPTRQGYTFLGWATSSGASSAQYNPGSSFTTDANTTLYAVWRKDEAISSDINFELSSSAAVPGSTVELTLKVTGTTKIDFITVYDFVYDKSVLEFQGISEYGDLVKNCTLPSNAFDNDTMSFTMGYVSPVTASGTIAVLKFKVKNNVPEKDVTVSYKAVATKDRREVESSAKTSVISISKWLPGDFNDDGIIDMKDSVRFIGWVGAPFLPQFQINHSFNADFNKDGRIDMKDAARYIGWVGAPFLPQFKIDW